MPPTPPLKTWLRRRARQLSPALSSLVEQAGREGVAPLIDRGRRLAARAIAPDDASSAAGGLAVRAPDAAPRAAARTPGLPDSAFVAEMIIAIVRTDSATIGRAQAAIDELLRSRDLDPTLGQFVYRLDEALSHLRHGRERLMLLSGQRPVDDRHEIMTLWEIIDEANASVEDYQRVAIGSVVSLAVLAHAAHDLARMLVELLRNGVKYSGDRVKVSAHLTESDSVVIRVEDSGVGIADDDLLAKLNSYLDDEAALDLTALQYQGLALVRHLARRHGMRVGLHRRSPRGTTAVVVVPGELMREPDPAPGTRPGAEDTGDTGRGPDDAGQEHAVWAMPGASRGEEHLSGDLAGEAARRANLTPVSPLAAGRHAVDDDGPLPTRTPGGLPMRARGQFAPPPPMFPPVEQPASSGAEPAAIGRAGRSPEEVRDGLRALADGLQRGRDPRATANPADTSAGVPRDDA